MRVLLAFDKFKDSLTANEACAAAAGALNAAHATWTVDACPLADGGEGFASILTNATGGELVAEQVTGPRGTPVLARFGLVATTKVPSAARALLTRPGAHPPAKIAIVEMAAASGLALLPPAQRDVWQTTTAGTGELIRAAVRRGAETIVLGVGGSATSDLGVGALGALGMGFESTGGRRIAAPVPATWPEISRLTGTISVPPIHIACDVTNPLLGPRGAAAVYGPQKGLRTDDVARLDHAAARLALMLCSHCGRPDSLMDAPGAGAAGGIAFGLMIAAGAQLLPGFDLVARWLDVEARIAAADLVVTGEGRFDDSSLSGKGPGAIATRALALGKPVHVFAGTIAAGASVPGLAVHAITPAGVPLERALAEAPENLRRAVARALG